MSAAPHLDNAARALERILNRRHPEHVFIVSVEPDGKTVANNPRRPQ